MIRVDSNRYSITYESKKDAPGGFIYWFYVDGRTIGLYSTRTHGAAYLVNQEFVAITEDRLYKILFDFVKGSGDL